MKYTNVRDTVESDRIVFYHGGCADGFTAAWVAKYHTQDWADATFVPCTYGEPIPPLPTVADKHVLVVDFSFPRHVLEKWARATASLLVLDHHLTAQRELAGLPYCKFDMDRSGAGLAWDILVATKRPWLVNVVEDRDLWRFRYGDLTKLSSAYISTIPHTFEAWNELNKEHISVAMSKGEAVQRYIDQYGGKARTEMRFEHIDEFYVPTINIPYMNCSEHVGKLAEDHPEAPFAAGYFRNKAGLWQFSLRSHSDFNVAEIAKRYGGGGHAGAAGFQVETLPWDEKPYVPTE